MELPCSDLKCGGVCGIDREFLPCYNRGVSRTVRERKREYVSKKSYIDRNVCSIFGAGISCVRAYVADPAGQSICGSRNRGARSVLQ